MFNSLEREIMDPNPAQHPTLESVTRPTVSTAEAAYYQNRRPQTLRCWAMTGHPIRPVRVYGRLAWPVSQIRKMLNVAGGQK